jgi:hypothetical protein
MALVPGSTQYCLCVTQSQRLYMSCYELYIINGAARLSESETLSVTHLLTCITHQGWGVSACFLLECCIPFYITVDEPTGQPQCVMALLFTPELHLCMGHPTSPT